MSTKVKQSCEFCPGDAYPGPERPDCMAECTERIHKAIYRVLIAGAVLAGVYNAPVYASNPLDPSNDLTYVQRESLTEFSVFRMISSHDEDEKAFGAFATWLCDSILADTKARRDMAVRHEGKTGRGLCCVRNTDDEDNSDRMGNEDEEVNYRECQLLEADGLSHSDAHLVIWQVMQMLHVHQQINFAISRSPNVTPPKDDPLPYKKIPIVFFGEFRAQEVCFTRINVHGRNDLHMILRPATHRIADKRRIHYSESQNQGHWGTVLDWIHSRSGQPNTYVETNDSMTPLRCKVFDYMLRHFASVRFPLDYFQERWNQHWGDFLTFERSFNIFSSDEVSGREPMQNEYIDGDFCDGSEVLTRVGAEPATNYN
ncbi:hypothetical protein NLG97_g1297 [Lecanicillium saksenae]|uniref:Uncharacterized protein n=1 Tax=Lecanicillium saksenae TaxID=468837 RepID=A0ACC1R456_9HYPO|nr:hypothetical protein NLG97_g1297 [Lecanicillium saksenae]